MKNFDLGRALHRIHNEHTSGHAGHVATIAGALAHGVAETMAERDAAVATIAILRGAPTDFDLTTVLDEIRTHTGGTPSILGELAMRLAFRLFATRSAGVITIDALGGADLTETQTELRDVANHLMDDLDDVTSDYIETVRVIQGQHLPHAEPQDGGACHPECPACAAIATVPTSIAVRAAAYDQSGATA